METPASLLIVDGDRDFALMLAREAQARAYRVHTAASVAEAVEQIQLDAFDAVIVDLAPGADTAFTLMSKLKELSSDAEVLVMSDRTSMAAAIQWFDPDAFALVRKADLVHLFAVLGRALERRRITAQNRRLVWELQTINEIASGISRSLDLNDILTGALQRLVHAMNAIGGSIRLRDRATGQFDECANVGPQSMHAVWERSLLGIQRPSDAVIAGRVAVVVEDFAALVSGNAEAIPLRSAISVPMLADREVLGTLSVGSTRPRRFQIADQRLLTVIAGQIVVAVQNAQLHHTVQRAKREWEQTFDAISDPIAVFNNRGELLRGNRALADHLSVPITAMRQLTCDQVGFCGGNGNCPECAVRRALNDQESRGEVTLPDGKIFSVTTFPIGPASAGPSVVQVAKNVTEEIRNARRLKKLTEELAATNSRLLCTLGQLKSTQAQLLQAEKLSAIGQLVAGVAHELNNPLTSVIGYAQLVEEELRADPNARPADEVALDLRRIAEESERAARIVRNLLAFARRQTAARAAQDLGEVCRRVVALREYGLRMSNVELHLSFPASLPRVLADSGQLQQVILNLFLNAEQAMHGQTMKRLSIAARHDTEANAVELSVTDSGHGIEAANLSRVFDPFFTTREVGEGTGLGLSICYGIVRDHGGQITIESKMKEGTTFRVLLPASPDVAPAEPEVLVAHAEQTEREFIAAALRGWGYQPVIATSVGEALDRYLDGTLQLAIIDRGILASDLDMWQARRSGDRPRDLPVIVTSVAPDDPATEPFTSAEAAAVVSAPLSLQSLNSAVQRVVKEYA